MGVCNCSMFCCTLLYVHSSIAIILMGKRELVALLNLSSWCLVMVEWLFLAVPWGCLRFVIVALPDHTHLLFPMWYLIPGLCLLLYFNCSETSSQIKDHSAIVYTLKLDTKRDLNGLIYSLSIKYKVESLPRSSSTNTSNLAAI